MASEIREGPSALEVIDLTKSFYGVKALDGLSFSLQAGELVGLIGPNGSGKTTAIDCISGYLRPDHGRIVLQGNSLDGFPPHTTAKRGLIRTFQTVRVFGSLSVRRNLTVAAMGKKPFVPELLDFLGAPDAFAGEVDRADSLIERFGLRRVAEDRADSLSYGQRKLVEFAAALMQDPAVLLLDEPVAAVNPTIGNLIRDLIQQLHGHGLSILLVEHNIELVTDICQRLIVLDQGRLIADGPPNEVVAEPHVQEAYLGR